MVWLTAGATVPALSLERDDQARAHVELLSRQVPLPEGDWVALGRATNSPLNGTPGVYGTIENAILVRRTEGRIDGVVEINTNRLSLDAGWGTATDCAREDTLARVVLYKTPVDGFCLFVAPTEIGVPDIPGPKAWETVAPALHADATPPTPVWLTVGFRVSDRYDVLDVRYHFDPSALGIAPKDGDAWTIDAVLKAPERYDAVKLLTAWGGLASGMVEDGFRGALVDRMKGAALPNPWEVTALKDDERPDPQGRASKASRIAALAALVQTGAISPSDHAAYAKAIEDEPPPPSPEDYYRLLGMKVFSFNFFRVSVDYILAFVVTVNSLVSGYITAAIVVTHSIAQVFNDMYWDNYILTQASAKATVVDFVQIGTRPGETL
jgi:hypothetical protein